MVLPSHSLGMAVGVLGYVLGTRRGSVCKRVSACVREHVRDCDGVCITTVQASGRYHLGYKGPKPTPP